MTLWVALIRGVGPNSHKKMSMADLRDAATKAGLKSARTLLATGNLIFESDDPEAELAATLDRIITSFDLTLPVILRRADVLPAVRDANPFPDAAADRPSKLLVMFLDGPPATLPEPPGDERLTAVGNEVFIDFAGDISTSKLAPGALDRKMGRTGTTRNWNTLLKLIEATA